MRRFIFISCLLAVLLAPALARVVREAPDITWTDPSGKARSLEAFRGQPVVVLIAPTPRDRRFRSQIKRLWNDYARIADLKAVVLVAFTREPGQPKTNIPVVFANNGPQVGFAYDSPERFAIAIIGRDGNLDYVTDQVLPGQRVIDVINNSFVAQDRGRRE